MSKFPYRAPKLSSFEMSYYSLLIEGLHPNEKSYGPHTLQIGKLAKGQSALKMGYIGPQHTGIPGSWAHGKSDSHQIINLSLYTNSK